MSQRTVTYLKALVAANGITIEYADTLDGAKGVSHGGRIELLSDLVPVQEFEVLTHEFAHELLHQRDAAERPGSKKVREAERRWIPFILVVGDREAESGEFTVRTHGGEQRTMSLDGLNATIEKVIAGRPFRPLNVPIRLSERPIFVG